MNFTFSQLLKLFNKDGNFKLFKESKHGFERECLRVNSKGELSKVAHPKALGSALKNPFITTDFSEAQLELITPPLNSEETTLRFIDEIYNFVTKNLDNEYLWPANMPCKLPKEKDIPLAYYGESNDAKKKVLYRQGLSYRYGSKMQTVSGTHYNFSFSDNFWKFLQTAAGAKNETLIDFKSAGYLRLIRNFLRLGWLNTYLFGASPAIDKTYLLKKHPALKKLHKDTYYGQYATSLRLSEIGYYSKGQAQLAVSFNKFDEYLADIEYAINTPSKAYKNTPGLNDHILQIEAEHYSRIRPKQISKEGERVLEALKKRGIEYVEARSVDIDPYCPMGICCDQLYFLHIFLVYCFFKDSPNIKPEDRKEITGNQNRVALYGRKENLTLMNNGKDVSLKDWGKVMLDELLDVAKMLDRNVSDQRYSSILVEQFAKLEDANLTPSARMIYEMTSRKEDFSDFALRLAKKYHGHFLKKNLPKNVEKSLKDVAEKSLKEQVDQEVVDEALLEGYTDMEVSTQILIREAFKRGIKVEVIDKKDNFIRLSRGRKVEFVKQATKTSKDSYMAYLLMENKLLSKFVLAEHGINVPSGGSYSNLEDAIIDYPKYQHLKIVVKPKSTNFGIGVSFVEKKSISDYKRALKNAFLHDKSVIVEEYIPGKEYRFLVLGYKTAAILNRIPANVTGDGVHTIKELVKIKNEDPRYYKFFNTYTLRTGKVETEHLSSQKLKWSDVLKKGRQVFLRTNSNVATGGDPIDYTDEMHQTYKKIAELAAKSVEAKFCGVDMIVSDIKKAADKKNHSIIEINFNPALQMHEYPVRGKKRNTAKIVLDILGF